MTKNEQIRQSLLETREKRKSQECKVYSLKIQTNKLSKKQKESLKMMFVEGKWFWNHIVNFTETNDLKDVNTKIKKVKHFDKDHNEVISDFNYLSSQQKLGLYKNFISNTKTLSTLKKKGKKVGRIRYISDLKSLPLVQYGNTYKIVDHNKVKIVNVGTVKVQGLEQFVYDKDVEYANANLVHTSSGYYLKIATFKKKEEYTKPEKVIGIDLGISTHLTTSDGEKISVLVEETERLKKLQRKMQKQKKNSNNRNKTRLKIQKEYEKMCNRREDLANKIVHDLTDNQICVFQDEQLHAWSGTFGKTIQHSILGRVKAKLMKNPNAVCLNAYLPTTKLCRNCGKYHDLSLSDRTFSCECGITEDRDIHASKNMIFFYKNNIGVGRTKFKHVEIEKQILEAISKSSQSEKHEASTPKGRCSSHRDILNILKYIK